MLIRRGVCEVGGVDMEDVQVEDAEGPGDKLDVKINWMWRTYWEMMLKYRRCGCVLLVDEVGVVERDVDADDVGVESKLRMLKWTM